MKKLTDQNHLNHDCHDHQQYLRIHYHHHVSLLSATTDLIILTDMPERAVMAAMEDLQCGLL
jgi:hypothetical protein